MNHHDLIAAPLPKVGSQTPPNGRGTKFTPERIQQIMNLVERGKSREEIAELVGVTVGSLQVTCSRLGISLRRPRFDNGVRLLRRGRPALGNRLTTPDPGRGGGLPPQLIEDRSRQKSPPEPLEQVPPTTIHEELSKSKEAGLANLVLTMRYRGKERTTELPLALQAIGQLALEAALRDMRIGELIGELITATIHKNLLQQVLDIS
jgi:hypothetical protein